MDTITSAAQQISPDATPTSIKSDESTPPHDSGRGSPPPNCAICLGTCRNKSFTDSCLHQFCFKCLLTWSKVKPECPLCKQNFKSIIHNVRSNHQYEEYLVEQRQIEEIPERIDIDSLTSVNRRFRYRTTLTLPRRETMAIQRFLMQYPLVADVLPPPAPPAPPRRRSPAAYRRTVYRHNLWARPLPDFTGRFRDCSPEFYRYNDSQLHRLVPWLNRELHYLLNENAGHIAYVIARVLELLPRYHITSDEVRLALGRYFGDRTTHFLHELYCFASTPFDLAGYDRNVQYTTDSRFSTMVTELSSTDSEASADSDIVMVSSSHPAPGEVPAGPSGGVASRAPAARVIPIETISHSDSDDSSSEVMVVGYIKPPAERTPEVVDLLGSDSDVVLNEEPSPARPAPSAPSAPPAAPAPAPVRVSIKRAASPAASPAPSPGDEWRPPSAEPASSTTTTSAAPTPSAASTASTVSTAPSSPSSSSSAQTPPRRYRKKIKTKRRRERTRSRSHSRNPEEASSSRTEKRSTKKRKRSRSSRRRRSRSAERARRSKRKSSSGRGVKSSRRRAEPAAAAGAGAGAAAGGERERRRLRSVVTVMHKHSGDSSSSGTGSFLSLLASALAGPASPRATPPPPASPPHTPPPPASDSDSDDDRPLNLSLQKHMTYTSL